MIKHVIFFLFLFASCLNSLAQKNVFEAGLLLNINRCTFHGKVREFLNYDKYQKIHLGSLRSSGGIFVKRYFSEQWYGKLEMRYIEKGITTARLKDATNSDIWQSLVLSYFEVPFLLGYKAKLKKRYLLLESGFAFSKLVGTRTTQTNYITTSYLKADYGTFEKNDFSWIGELIMPLNHKKRDNLFLSFRFSHSIFSINNKYELLNSLYGIELCYLLKRK